MTRADVPARTGLYAISERRNASGQLQPHGVLRLLAPGLPDPTGDVDLASAIDETKFVDENAVDISDRIDETHTSDDG